MMSANGTSAPLAKKQKSKKQKAEGTAKCDDEYDDEYKLGGVDAACCQLLFGFEVSTVNQRKLFDTSPVKVANNLIKRIVYEDDERGHVSEIKRDNPRLPFPPGSHYLQPGFRVEFERLVRYVLKHSTKAVSSISGQQPDEPWIASFCKAVRTSKDLRDVVSVPTVAETITEIANTCLQSVDQQKLAEVEQKSEATVKRKATHDAELSQRLGFGAHPVPKAGGTVTCEAGFGGGDFNEHGELVPDSDCEDEGSEWNGKVARYCKLTEQKGPGMDLKGRSPAQIPGARLTVYYDEKGDGGKGKPWEAVGQGIGKTPDFMWVSFLSTDEMIAVTDDDDWDWQDRV